MVYRVAAAVRCFIVSLQLPEKSVPCDVSVWECVLCMKKRDSNREKYIERGRERESKSS